MSAPPTLHECIKAPPRRHAPSQPPFSSYIRPCRGANHHGLGHNEEIRAFWNRPDRKENQTPTNYDCTRLARTQGCRLTVAQVIDLLTHQVSTQTIQNKIHKLGKQSCISPKKPYLQPQDFQGRLAFAHAYRHWIINNWAWVIWKDKSAFKLGKKVDWVCVLRTPQEKWQLENLAVNHQSGCQTLMVWGAFCAAMQAPLVFLNGQMTLAKMVQQVY
ncbi:hypothetical protein O181_005869 [Austropuccinia psidii MF-1]|uniref:Transposase Tc1-like domain-containing protein n=1 Tax=Austropuccinia psidii MF-1 TaxID=1389203 RepID=A0A9Q3BIB2_9BASI|nr:hypothetical protein [Austropuccinia psidii MF-1]